ncbi:MAG: cyclic nucleotide-binding domain-containing protein [Magnetococcales bacterium]|nr:cyclic nucleotide-binding domain-containing protein [Magnetococcales bacterium]
MKTGKPLKPEYHNLLMVLDADSPTVLTVQERVLQLLKNNSKASVTGVALPVEKGDAKSPLAQAKSAFQAAGINYKGYLLKNSNRQLFALIKEKQYDLIVLGIGSDEEAKAIEQSTLLITLLAKVTCDLLIIRPDQIPEFVPPHFQVEKASRDSLPSQDKQKAVIREAPQGKDYLDLLSNNKDIAASKNPDENPKASKVTYDDAEKQGGGNILHDEVKGGGVSQDNDGTRGGNIPDSDGKSARGNKVPEGDDERNSRGKIPEVDDDERRRRGLIPNDEEDARKRRGLIPNDDEDARKRRGRIPGDHGVDGYRRRGKIPGGGDGENQRKGRIPTGDDDESGYSSQEVHEMMDHINFFRNFSNYEKKRCANTESSIVIFEPETEIIREGGRDTFFYIILSGSVNVFKGKLQINSMGEGDFFGEMAFLTNTERSTSVIAAQRVVAYRLDRLKMKRMQSSIREKIKDQCIEKLVGHVDRLTERLLELM